MKKLSSLLLAVLLVFANIPATFANAAGSDAGIKLINSGNVVIDDDGSDGYAGDYVVIYNPATSGYGTKSTGNMSGLIETDVGASMNSGAAADRLNLDRPYSIDVDSIIMERDRLAGTPEKPVESSEFAALSFNVGDTHTFTLNSTYCPLPSTSVEFKVLAKGEHCYIWTPTSTNANVHPLDSIDPTFGDVCAAEFDSKFDLMQSSFGNHLNGSQGDGRLSILYYNVDDGWQPGDGYVGGFFSASDLLANNMPVLNIDTYPGVQYETLSGDIITRVEDTFNTTVHEYQHLINYSECGYTDTWINECMSAAAEEICYPGSSISGRIQSWMNYKFSVNEDWHNPPAEHAYVPDWSLHNGYSMYSWSNYLAMNDRLALYAQVSLFSQYIYTQYGNTTYRAILQKLAANQDFVAAFQNVTGQDTSEFVGNFRIAMIANTTPNQYDGVYGFRMQEGYDPETNYGVENLYNWLSPVVFTGSQCSISSGGAITVKPVGGVYNPPSDAANGLLYYGVTLDAAPEDPVALTGISLSPSSVSAYAGQTVTVSAVREPENANNYELSWTSADPAVATVSGNSRRAVVTGVAPGSTIVTVDAHDLINDVHYSATVDVTVLSMPTLNSALNIENGTLNFDNTTSSYPWTVDLSESGRISARSGNTHIASSRSSFGITVDVQAGDTMSFDWKVSSETNYDRLKFFVNGTERGSITGERDWATFSYTFDAAGTYTLLWEYHKDISADYGSDCGWVDNVYIPNQGGNDDDFIMGDTDMDGTVTIVDAVLTLRAALGLVTLTDEQILRANVDSAEGISATDALLIMRMAMELA